MSLDNPNATHYRYGLHYVLAICTTVSILTFHTISNQQSNSRRRLQFTSTIQHHDTTFEREANPFQPAHHGYNPDDIRTPSDMWRHPSNFTNSWTPIPLPNCCAHIRSRRPTQTHSRKFLTKCKDEPDTVRYYGPGTGLTPDDLIAALYASGGDLVLIGDSMTRQWFEQLSCYLGGWESWDGFAADPIEVNRGQLENVVTEKMMQYRPHWRKRRNLGTMSRQDSSFASFNLPKSLNGSQRQRVIYNGVNYLAIAEVVDLIDFYNNVYPKEFRRGQPTIVINLGMHYNEFGEGGDNLSREDLLNDLRTLIRACRKNGARCIFRETSPQHFANPAGDGLFFDPTRGVKRQCMRSPPESFTTLNRWRNDALHELAVETESLRERGGIVRVMPLFDRLAALHHAHNVIRRDDWVFEDCTHFAMDPEFWEPWHVSLTEVLRDTFVNVVG